MSDHENYEHEDPRLRPADLSGMPAETIDTEHNLPGQQGPPPADNAEPATAGRTAEEEASAGDSNRFLGHM